MHSFIHPTNGDKTSDCIKGSAGILSLIIVKYIRAGVQAVDIFFVLSGFLIGYILLKEHKKT